MEGGESSTDLVINKRFVSEAELEERRKRRQEEWEKVRKPEDPKGIWLSVGGLSKESQSQAGSMWI